MRSKFLLVIVSFFLIGFVSASYLIGNQSSYISNESIPGGSLSGWINISFNEHPSQSLFTDNKNNSITLEKLLSNQINSNYIYTCDLTNCEKKLSPSNSSSKKQFFLNSGESKLVGIKFEGMIESVTSFELLFSSNASSSCVNQFNLNFFNDGLLNIGNSKMSLNSCGNTNYGCYNTSSASQEASIDSTPYCQEFNVTSSPGFEIGAWIKEFPPGNANITMGLYNLYGELLSSCQINKTYITSSGSEISCPINYFMDNPTKVYVCISTNSPSTGTYKIKGYSPSGEKCGFKSFPPGTTKTSAYHIFVKERMFDSVGALIINDSSTQNSETLSSKIYSYLQDGYSLNCENGCIIPLNITSYVPQTITLENLNIIYDKTGFSGTIEDKLWDLHTTYPKISSNFQKLHLNEAEFKLPETIGNFSYILSFGGDKILEKNLKIINLSISLTPNLIPVAFPTTFNLEINTNISQIYWNFGDGKNGSSLGKSITHTFVNEGDYNLRVEISLPDGQIFQKNFPIKVIDSKELIQSRISDLEEKVVDLESKMSSFDSFTILMIKNYLNFDEKKAKINNLKSNFSVINSSGGDYKVLIPSILNLSLPKSIQNVSIAPLTYFPLESSINLNPLKEIFNSSGYSGEGYISGIQYWHSENLETKIGINKILFLGDQGENLGELRVFKFNLFKKNTISEDFYLIIGNLEGLTLNPSSGVMNSSGFKFIKANNLQNIEIFTTEKIEFLDLPIFLSPDPEKVKIEEDTIISEEPGSLKILIIILLILVLFSVGLYFFLKRWYKLKYEKYLFPNRNDLYNIVTYISNLKLNNKTNEEIKVGLKKAGWSSEQITYVMKKYEGKNTGMPGTKQKINKENNLNKKN